MSCKDFNMMKEKEDLIKKLGLRKSIIIENDQSFKEEGASLEKDRHTFRALSNKWYILNNKEQLMKVLKNSVDCDNISYELEPIFDHLESRELKFISFPKKYIVISNKNLRCLVDVEVCPLSNNCMYTVEIKDLCDEMNSSESPMYFCRIWDTTDLVHLLNNPYNYIKYMLLSDKIE